MLESVEDFYKGVDPSIEALGDAAEVAFAWTLRYPEFHVAFVFGRESSRPVVFVVPSDPAFENFLDDWIGFSRSDQRLAQLYDYWILGREAEPPTPRWSVIRNVLGWVK